jgi:hypothetical protein
LLRSARNDGRREFLLVSYSPGNITKKGENTMTIIYRHEKGSPLTVQEIDGNFRELETRINTLSETQEHVEGLGKISLEGDQIRFTGTFGADFGSFTLPQPPSGSLPLYERASLPASGTLGQLGLLLEDEGPTLIFFNGNHWQRLKQGEKL